MHINRKILLAAALGALALAAALVPAVGHAVQSVVAFVGPENIASLGFMGSVATTITKDVAYTGVVPVNPQPRDASVFEIPVPINFPAAAPVLNDTQALIKLPPGVQVVDWFLSTDQVDSNGAPTMSLEFGELAPNLADMALAYASGITIGRTGGLQRAVAASAAADPRVISGGSANLAKERVIGIKWDAVAATYAASKTALLVLRCVG